MRALRWVGVGLVAMVGVALAVAASVWIVKPSQEQAGTLPTATPEAVGRRTLKTEPTEPMLMSVRTASDFNERKSPSVENTKPAPIPAPNVPFEDPQPLPKPAFTAIDEQKPIPLPFITTDTGPLPKPAEDQKPIPLPTLPGDALPLPKAGFVEVAPTPLPKPTGVDFTPLPKPPPVEIDPLPLPKPAPVELAPPPLPKPSPIDISPLPGPSPLPVPPIEAKPKFVDPVPVLPPLPKTEPKIDPLPLPKPNPVPVPKFDPDPVPVPKFTPEPKPEPLPEPKPKDTPKPLPRGDEDPFIRRTPEPLPKSDQPAPHYLNRPELEFDYTVGKKGKSGVKSVTLFARDPARSTKEDKPRERVKGDDSVELFGNWKPVDTQPVKEDSSPKLRVKLPKDGPYEFRLGVTSGNGNAATPKESDPVDLVVIVDTVSPVVSKFEAKVDPATNVVNFAIRVDDANPTDALLVEYRTSPSGAWLPVKLTNSMAWAVPDDLPAEVAVRMTVTDKAGNVTTKTIDKVNLDTTIPEGKLTRVRPTIVPDKPKEGPKEPEAKKPELYAPLPTPKPVDLPPTPVVPPHKVDRIK